MPHETLIVERDGPVLKVAMNRPEARNALSPAMVRELTQAFQQARDDAGIRVVVLMGAGGNFCAGGDLKGMERARTPPGGGGASRLPPPTGASARCWRWPTRCPRRVIALIEGAAMGGGVGPRRHRRLGHRREERADRHARGDGRHGAGANRAVPGVRASATAQARRLAAFGLRLDAEEA